jgi:hypothetical protein
MRSTLSSTLDPRGATNLDSLDAVDLSRRGRGAAETNQRLVSHFAETRPHLFNLERLEAYGTHECYSTPHAGDPVLRTSRRAGGHFRLQHLQRFSSNGVQDGGGCRLRTVAVRLYGDRGESKPKDCCRIWTSLRKDSGGRQGGIQSQGRHGSLDQQQSVYSTVGSGEVALGGMARIQTAPCNP